MLSYSNSTFDNDNTVPSFPLKDGESTINSNLDKFNELLASLLNSLVEKAAASAVSGKKFAAGDVNLSSMQTLYGMAQCLPDLSSDSCQTCFGSAIAKLPTCCNGSEGVKILIPSCNIRYQLYPFLYNITSMKPRVPSPSSGNKSTLIVVAIVVPIGIFAGLLVIGCCWLRRRQNKNHEPVLEVNDSSNIFFFL